jgi:hypothetical protein
MPDCLSKAIQIFLLNLLGDTVGIYTPDPHFALDLLVRLILLFGKGFDVKEDREFHHPQLHDGARHTSRMQCLRGICGRSDIQSTIGHSGTRCFCPAFPTLKGSNDRSGRDTKADQNQTTD